MNSIVKVFVTFVAVVIAIFLMGTLKAITGDNSSHGGILGLIIGVALIGALRAIWKKKKIESSEDTKLDKN